VADQLRAEQYRKFRGETWLEELLRGSRVSEGVTAREDRAGAPVG